MRTKARLAGVIVLLALIGTGAACTPQAATPTETWRIEATQVTVNDSQDEYCPVVCLNRSDEPYLLQVAFKVKLGVNSSATAWVVGDRDNDPDDDVAAGETRNLDGPARGTAVFTGIQGLDVSNLLDANNHLDVFGTYTWAAEKDEISIASAANGTATILRNALNTVLGTATGISNDPNVLSQQIRQNVGAALGIFVQNLPTLGLGDDVLGGSLQIGVGARGTLGQGLDQFLVPNPIAPMPIPNLTLPPDILGGRFFTLTRSPHIFYQTYTGAGGQHTYKMRIAKDVVVGNSGIDVPEGGFSGNLVSPGGVRLAMQGDGNLVIYAPASQGGLPIWDSGTYVNGSSLWMQSDGNLVIYNENHDWVWDTATDRPGSVATLQDDGNLVVYGPGHIPLWESRSHI